MKKKYSYAHSPLWGWKKALFLIKLRLIVAVLYFGSILPANAVHSQPKFDVSFDNQTIYYVLGYLKTHTGYTFSHMEGAIPQDMKVTVEMKDATLTDILDKIFVEQGCNYTVEDRLIVISPGSGEVQGQAAQQPAAVTVTGKVRGEDGMPLAGVTVTVKGTTRGAATDANGNFSLSVRSGEVLVFSYIGRKTLEVEYAGQETVNVVLEEDATVIQDIIITGIFDRPRESYTGSVTTITERELKIYRGQNMLQTLSNIDPAINIAIDNAAGSNPNRTYGVTIRGNSSLPQSLEDLNQNVGQQLNTPLIIMDGFEITLEKLMDFNDEEIESINILKDASATSIYGSRGANGVIVIKTKTPQPGELRIYLQAGLNLEIPDLSSYNLLGAQDKLQLERMVGLYDDSTNPDDDRELKEIYNMRLSEALRGETDWLREPVRVGVGRRLNLRMEGGSEEFRWSVSVGNNSTTGAMKGSVHDATSVAITLSYHYKNLIFRNQSGYDYAVSDNGSYGSFSTFASMNPYNRARDEEGNVIKSWQGWDLGSQIYSPLADAMLNSKDISRSHSITDIFSIEWSVAKGLNVRGQLGVTKTLGTTDVYVPAEHSSFQTVYYTSGEGFFRKGSYDYTSSDGILWDGSFTISYSKTFLDKHVLYAGFNTSIGLEKTEYYLIKAEGLLNQDFSDLTNALQYAEGTTPDGGDSRTSRLGFTGNVNYTFDNRYFVDASLRLDGSSQFGTNNKYAPFWSLGVGWNLHREKFMENQYTVDVFRLRLSYGQTGSQQFDAYQAKSMYNFLTSKRYVYWTAAELMGLGNEDLKWQRTDQWNVGLDAELFNNRITAQLDVYYKYTRNLLSAVDIPQSHGFSSYAENIGEVENYGFEAMLGGYVVQNADRSFMWNITTQLVYTKDVVVRLSDAIKDQVDELLQTSENANLIFEGYSQNSIYAVRSLGIDPIDGREIFLDQNGNITKTWNAADRVYSGVSQSPYRGTISNLIIYKNFTFNLSFAFYWGGKQYNETLINKVEMSNREIQNNVDRRVLSDRWQNPGDVTFFKGYSENSTRASTRFVMDDNVLQLQSASLQYRWSTPFVHNTLRAQTINFSVNMSDLFYLSSIKRERGTGYPFARNVQIAVSLLF